MKATVFFDFDSTIVSVETLDAIAEIALANHPDKDRILGTVREITDRGMNGGITISESLSERLRLIGVHRSHIQKLRETITQFISPSFLTHENFIRTYAGTLYIVSGGFDELIFPVSDRLGIDHSHVFANSFVYDDTGMVTSVLASNPLSQQGGKARVLESIEATGVKLMVGDGMTDLETRTLGAADAFLYYAEHVYRENIAREADGIVKSFDELVAHLARYDFISS